MRLVKIKPLNLKFTSPPTLNQSTGAVTSRHPFIGRPKAFNIDFKAGKKYHYLLVLDDCVLYSYHLNGLLEIFGEKDFDRMEKKIEQTDDGPRLLLKSDFGDYEICEFETIENLDYLTLL